MRKKISQNQNTNEKVVLEVFPKIKSLRKNFISSSSTFYVKARMMKINI